MVHRRHTQSRAIAVYGMITVLVVANLAGSFTPACAAVPATRPQQTGESLQLPGSAFSPGTVDSGAVLDNSRENITNTDQWPRVLHSIPYDSLGRKTGYIQGALWQPPGATDSLFWVYASSVFSTEDSAKTAWQDGSTSFPSTHEGVTTADCSSTVGVPCTRITVSNSTLSDELQYNQCLAETTVGESLNETTPATTDHLMQTQLAQAASTLTRIDIAAVAAMKAACLPPPDFTLLAARFEPSGGSYDYNSPALTTATVGQTVALAAYLTVRQGPAACPDVLTFDVSRDGSAINHQVLSLATCLSTTPVRYAVNQKLDQPGTYTLTITATVQDVSQHQTASLVAARPTKVKRPSKPSYSFDSLTILNKYQQPQSSFQTAEQGYLRMTWTARHLSGKQQADIQISYQVLRGRAWQTLASPLPLTVPTTNGLNSYKNGFFAPKGYSAMRFTVAMRLLGRWSTRKTVTVSIHK
jgi:hypothetical protein